MIFCQGQGGRPLVPDILACGVSLLMPDILTGRLRQGWKTPSLDRWVVVLIFLPVRLGVPQSIFFNKNWGMGVKSFPGPIVEACMHLSCGGAAHSHLLEIPWPVSLEIRELAVFWILFMMGDVAGDWRRDASLR